MGLKDWLAGNVMGASGYGAAMGRESVKNGIVFGRTLYLGHGTRGSASDKYTFKDAQDMRLHGFELYCSDQSNRPPMEDSTELSKHTRAAGITFVTQCALTAASNFMNDRNASAFNRSVGSSTREELERLNLGLGIDLILYYLKLPRPAGIKDVLNLESPGSNDLLAVYLAKVSTLDPGRTIGFQRTGVAGFEVIAVPLAEQTVLTIREAAQKYGW